MGQKNTLVVMTIIAEGALFRIMRRIHNNHVCFQVRKLAGTKQTYRDDACFEFEADHMADDNRRALTTKCTSKKCESLWAMAGLGKEDNNVLPKHTVCASN
jgi:hypothetical protein